MFFYDFITMGKNNIIIQTIINEKLQSMTRLVRNTQSLKTEHFSSLKIPFFGLPPSPINSWRIPFDICFYKPKCHSVSFFGGQWKNYFSDQKKFSFHMIYSFIYGKNVLCDKVFFFICVTGNKVPVTRNILSFTGKNLCVTDNIILLSQEVLFL